MNVQPAFFNHKTAIVFSANDFFIPYTAVMVQSIINHASASNLYDILILSKSLSRERTEKLLSMVEVPNIRIRIVDMKEVLHGFHFFTENRADITEETYFRLCIPWILQDYDKAVYLDGDMLTKADVAELYDVDISNVFLAAPLDYLSLTAFFMPSGATLNRYRTETIGLKNPENYFCAAVLVMNLNEFRRVSSMEQLLTLAGSHHWNCHDQDTLNCFVKERFHKLPPEWGTVELADPLPQCYRVELARAVSAPKLVHFAGWQKPWLQVGSIWQDEFWETAIQSPFFYDIIGQNVRTISAIPRDAVLQEFQNGSIGFRYIKAYFQAWLQFKLRKK